MSLAIARRRQCPSVWIVMTVCCPILVKMRCMPSSGMIRPVESESSSPRGSSGACVRGVGSGVVCGAVFAVCCVGLVGPCSVSHRWHRHMTCVSWTLLGILAAQWMWKTLLQVWHSTRCPPSLQVSQTLSWLPGNLFHLCTFLCLFVFAIFGGGRRPCERFQQSNSVVVWGLVLCFFAVFFVIVICGAWAVVEMPPWAVSVLGVLRNFSSSFRPGLSISGSCPLYTPDAANVLPV